MADINAARSIYTYGVDTLVSVEFRNRLASSLQSELSISELLAAFPYTSSARKLLPGRVGYRRQSGANRIMLSRSNSAIQHDQALYLRTVERNSLSSWLSTNIESV